jgi:ESS family glutamate:Na+ symporter
MPPLIASALAVAALLAISTAIHRRFSIFERIYIPASVIAGALGLLLVSLLRPLLLDSTLLQPLDQLLGSLRGWPGYLIAIVFAAMLLQPPSSRRGGSSVRAVTCEALMVGVIALGQTAIGLLVTGWLIQPFYDVPNSFGMLIETGFAGGHGTAAAMGQVFATPEIAFPVGLDLGLLMATVGLVYGTLSGIVWINVVLRNPQSFAVPPQLASDAIAASAATLRTDDAQVTPADASQLVPPRGVSSRYATQALWIAVAFVIGLTLQAAVLRVAEHLDRPDVSAAATEVASPEALPAASALSATSAQPTQPASPLKNKLSWVSLVGGFPMFIYTLLGGLVISRLLVWQRRASWLDGPAGGRLSGIAMDLLVVAAIATLNLEAVATYLIPMTLLFLGGAFWSGFCLLILAPRMLPKPHWFELGLINYGMSTGTTATGFVLLRLVDPELRTAAAKDYALAAPLSAPLVGGGVITIGLPLLLLERLPIAASTLLISLVVALLIFAGIRQRRKIVAPR